MGEVVLGVDTHRDVHVAALLSTLGAVVGTASFPATAVGYRGLWEWVSRLGTVRRAGVEGSGSYGAALSRYLLARRVEVFEVNRPDRSVRRRRGKSDPVDAQEAARAVLSGRARSQAKAGDGPVQCARLFKLAKDSARTQAINQLKAILVTADPDLREQLAGLKTPALVRTCAQFDDREDDDGVKDAVGQATRIALCLLAQRIDQLTGQIRDLERHLTGLVQRHFPQLLIPVGIGPDSAATLLITMGDNPERLCSEASFAALCGVSPVEHSSGRQRRHRLNRGGDRQANAALHRIVQSRLRFDARTRNYYERRIAEGKTRREIIRCLKRYAAREVFNLVRTGIGSREVAEEVAEAQLRNLLGVGGQHADRIAAGRWPSGP
uniref:IS110 family transposase n=1 Tax=Streptomyces decoyicus TaxID=249567 RepID=UPI000A3DA901|nr:IS110 family transposase [Streptomyces decoyicus]